MALTDAAIEKIKQMILDGDLVPGQRLPREADLAQRLGLSRNSLREAVRALALINVLDVRQGDGTYVTSLDSALLLDTLAFVVDLHRDDSVLQLFEVRRILEPAAAEIAAVRMSDEQIAAARAVLDEFDEAGQAGEAPGVDELAANDTEFHRQVAAGAGNAALCSLIVSMSTSTQRARVWRGLTQADAFERTMSEHRAIIDAIAARQPDLARSCATVHVAGIEHWLRQAVDPR